MVALYQLIKQFETQFASIARQILEEDQRADDNMTPVGACVTTGGWMVVHDLGANGQVSRSPNNSSSGSSGSNGFTSSGSGDAFSGTGPVLFERGRRSGATGSSQSNLLKSSYSNVYVQIWKTMLTLASDPMPCVKRLAQQLVNQINLKATVMAKPQLVLDATRRSSTSAPNSPSTRNENALPLNLSDSPPPTTLNIPNEIVKPVPIRAGEQPPPARPQNPGPIGSQFPHSQNFSRSRKIFDKGPSIVSVFQMHCIQTLAPFLTKV